MLMRLYRRFIGLMEHPLVAVALIAGNTIGALAGFPFWYGAQLLATPFYFWPLVPDSPGNAFLFVPAYLLIRYRKPGWSFLNALAAFGNLKYGLWTVVFWYAYWRQGGSLGVMGASMSFTHFVMALEGLYLLNYVRVSLPVAAGLGLWFLFNDWADYGPWNLHPGLPSPGLVPVMTTEAVISTVVIGLVLVGMAMWRRGLFRRGCGA